MARCKRLQWGLGTKPRENFAFYITFRAKWHKGYSCFLPAYKKQRTHGVPSFINDKYRLFDRTTSVIVVDRDFV